MNKVEQDVLKMLKYLKQGSALINEYQPNIFDTKYIFPTDGRFDTFTITINFNDKLVSWLGNNTHPHSGAYIDKKEGEYVWDDFMITAFEELARRTKIRLKQEQIKAEQLALHLKEEKKNDTMLKKFLAAK